MHGSSFEEVIQVYLHASAHRPWRVTYITPPNPLRIQLLIGCLFGGYSIHSSIPPWDKRRKGFLRSFCGSTLSGLGSLECIAAESGSF